MNCHSCGEELDPDSAFCSGCGTAILEDDASMDVSQSHDDPTMAGMETNSETQVVGGLDENVAGTLCYLFGFLTGLVFFLLEERNEFVRFHAAQSMLVFGGLAVLSIVFSVIAIFLDLIPVVGWLFAAGFGLVTALFWLVAGPLALILWLVLMLKAYKGERFELPVVGSKAKDLV